MLSRAPKAVLAVALVLSAGCVPRQPPEPVRLPEPTPKVLVEEDIVVPEAPNLAVLDVQEQREPGDTAVVVTGTVVNYGPGRARNLSVVVRVLDKNGNELASLPAETSASVLDARSSATFRLRLVRPPGTAEYRVVARAQ